MPTSRFAGGENAELECQLLRTNGKQSLTKIVRFETFGNT